MTRVRSRRPTDCMSPYDPHGSTYPSTRLAFVCTANVCRSPLAEQLARRESSRRGLALSVTSMGFLPGGVPTPPIGVRAAAENGIDLKAHRSRQLDSKELLRADAVLTMTRAHGRELVAALPELWPRVFTIKQFAAYVAASPPPRRAHFASWVASLDDVRQRGELMGDDTPDEIGDPLGRPIEIWRRTIAELEDLIGAILTGCATTVPHVGSAPR